MKVIAVFLLLVFSKEISTKPKSGDCYFISSGYRYTDFLIFSEDGSGELYHWGGSFRSRYDFEWNRLDSLYIINFREDAYQEESMIHEKKNSIHINQSDSIHFQKIRVLTDHQKFKRIGKNKFLRRYKEFLGQDAFQRFK